METFSQKRCMGLLALGVVTLFTGLQPALGQRATTDAANVTVLEGEEARIMCRHNTVLRYCRIEVPNEKTLVLSEEWDKLPMFRYNGDGLSKGQCGVTIKHAKAKHDGIIKCYLGIDGDELMATVGLTVAVNPTQPVLEVVSGNRRNIFKIDEQFSAKCSSRNGRPPSKLTWFLGEEQLFDNLSPLDIQATTANEQTLYTTSQTLTRYIRASDDRKQLVCRAAHVARGGTFQDATYQLQVRYGPRPQPQIRVFGIVQGVTSLINVTILANPQPSIEWTVNGETIYQGSQSGRYEALQPVRLNNGIYNVSLRIEDLTIEDTGLEYTLKASNEFGSESYSVLISSSEATAISDMGLAVGLSIGAAALIIILAVVVIYVKKICCFAVTSNKEEKDAEGQMAPQHDETDVEDYTDISKKSLQNNDLQTGEKTAV